MWKIEERSERNFNKDLKTMKQPFEGSPGTFFAYKE